MTFKKKLGHVNLVFLFAHILTYLIHTLFESSCLIQYALKFLRDYVKPFQNEVKDGVNDQPFKCIIYLYCVCLLLGLL